MPKVNSISFALWFAAIILYALLAFFIARKHAIARQLWLFLTAIAATALGTSLFILLETRRFPGYFWTYWIGHLMLDAFHFGIIYSIGCSLVGIAQDWRRTLLRAVATLSLVSLTVSAFVTLASPAPFYLAVTRAVTSLDRWISLGACILFVAIGFSFDALGLHWKREPILIGLGLALQGASVTGFAWVITALNLPPKHWEVPSSIRDAFELIAISLWIIAFCAPPRTECAPQIDTDQIDAALQEAEDFVSSM